MTRRLAGFVHVKADDGSVSVFGPDDVVPDWAAKRITNPKAWAATTETRERSVPNVLRTEPLLAGPGDHPFVAKPGDANFVGVASEAGTVAAADGQGDGSTGDQGGSDAAPPADPVVVPEAPPRAGAGSGRDQWEQYATALGIDVPDEAGRDDIVALVDAHNAQA